MRLLPGMVMLMLALVIAGSARATTDVMPFKDEAQEQFRQLTGSCAARNARTALRTRTRY
ncbi:hypothetical protein KCP69_03150 [Salmonella enterica subsp. enterica]|nr:hypothetical protein KCP69_03150 [Salmonella enterica subsp. enterica]